MVIFYSYVSHYQMVNQEGELGPFSCPAWHSRTASLSWNCPRMSQHCASRGANRGLQAMIWGTSIWGAKTYKEMLEPWVNIEWGYICLHMVRTNWKRLGLIQSTVYQIIIVWNDVIWYGLIFFDKPKHSDFRSMAPGSQVSQVLHTDSKFIWCPPSPGLRPSWPLGNWVNTIHFW